MEENLANLNIKEIAKLLLDLLKSKNLTLAVAESATGGYISNSLTNIENSSQSFLGGIICYSQKIKSQMLNVNELLMEKHGTVSYEVTEALLDGLHDKINADINLSITGIAGKNQFEGKKSGLVFIGIEMIYEGYTKIIKEFHFSGNREEIKLATTKKAFTLLIKVLKNQNNPKEDIV